jgi:hypothetical protein
MEPLAQLADQMLPAAELLLAVAAEVAGKEGEEAPRVPGEIWGRGLKVASHEAGEGFVASHQIAEAAVDLELAGLLQGGEPGIQALRGGHHRLGCGGIVLEGPMN